MLPAYSFSYQPYILYPSIVLLCKSKAKIVNKNIYDNNRPYFIASILPHSRFEQQNSNYYATNWPQMAFPAHLQPFYSI